MDRVDRTLDTVDYRFRMTVVYIIRHGETEWNLKGIHQGHIDSKLTPAGERQSDNLGKRFVELGIHFDAIYSSDLGRALETANRICNLIGQETMVQQDPALRERSLGSIEGLTYSELAERMPEDHLKHVSGDPNYRPEGGESWQDLYTRANISFKNIALRHDNEQILCVTHGGLASMLLHLCVGISLTSKRRFSLPNAAVNIFEFDSKDGWRLRTWGDTSHFENGRILDEML